MAELAISACTVALIYGDVRVLSSILEQSCQLVKIIAEIPHGVCEYSKWYENDIYAG